MLGVSRSVVPVHERKGGDTLDKNGRVGVGVVVGALGDEIERTRLDVADGVSGTVLHILGKVVELEEDGAVDVGTCGYAGEGEDLVIEDLVAVEALRLEGGIVAINTTKGLEEVREGRGITIGLLVVDDHDSAFGASGVSVDKGEVDVEAGHKDLGPSAVVVSIGRGDVGYGGKVHGVKAYIETRGGDGGLISIIATNGGVANIGSTGEGAGGAADGDRGTTRGPLEEVPAGGVAAAVGGPARAAPVKPIATGGLDRHLTLWKEFLCNRGLRGGRWSGYQPDDTHKGVGQ